MIVVFDETDFSGAKYSETDVKVHLSIRVVDPDTAIEKIGTAAGFDFVWVDGVIDDDVEIGDIHLTLTPSVINTLISKADDSVYASVPFTRDNMPSATEPDNNGLRITIASLVVLKDVCTLYDVNMVHAFYM